MAGTLIFTTHNEERERLAELLDGHITRNVNEVIEMLNAGKTVIVPMGLYTGWRAPAGTKILFSATFPKDGPHRAQAEMRVGCCITDDMVERATMKLLAHEKDPAPGIDWHCNRQWTVNRVRELMRAALEEVL